MGKRLLLPSGACKRVGRVWVGVQALVSYLCARLTLEEAVETLMRLVPLTMSARQAFSLMRPVGEALEGQEDEQHYACGEIDTATLEHMQERLLASSRHDDTARTEKPFDNLHCSLLSSRRQMLAFHGGFEPFSHLLKRGSVNLTTCVALLEYFQCGTFV